MADSETQEFDSLNFLKRTVQKVDRRVCQTVPLERDSESVRSARVVKTPMIWARRFIGR